MPHDRHSHAQRVRSIPPTIFSEMSALAARTGAINLGQGFPDADGPPSVIASAVAALEHGANQYAPVRAASADISEKIVGGIERTRWAWLCRS